MCCMLGHSAVRSLCTLSSFFNALLPRSLSVSLSLSLYGGIYTYVWYVRSTFYMSLFCLFLRASVRLSFCMSICLFACLSGCIFSGGRSHTGDAAVIRSIIGLLGHAVHAKPIFMACRIPLDIGGGRCESVCEALFHTE